MDLFGAIQDEQHLENPLVLAEPARPGNLQDEQQETLENCGDGSLEDRDSLSQLACSLHRLSKDDHIVIDR